MPESDWLFSERAAKVAQKVFGVVQVERKGGQEDDELHVTADGASAWLPCSCGDADDHITFKTDVWDEFMWINVSVQPGRSLRWRIASAWRALRGKQHDGMISINPNTTRSLAKWLTGVIEKYDEQARREFRGNLSPRTVEILKVVGDAPGFPIDEDQLDADIQAAREKVSAEMEAEKRYIERLGNDESDSPVTNPLQEVRGEEIDQATGLRRI